MKKTKIFTAILLVAIILISVSNIVLATSSTDAQKVITDITSSNANVDTKTITNFGGAIVKVAQVIGIVVAVVVLLVLGIKYLIGSAEEKAEYKKTFVPYIIGAILIFAATTIVNIVYDLTNSLQVK